MNDDQYFKIGKILGSITGIGVFFASWVYCTVNYGFLFGFGIGWLPSAILAAIIGGLMIVLWGVVALLILGGIALLVFIIVHGP